MLVDLAFKAHLLPFPPAQGLAVVFVALPLSVRYPRGRGLLTGDLPCAAGVCESLLRVVSLHLPSTLDQALIPPSCL